MSDRLKTADSKKIKTDQKLCFDKKKILYIFSLLFLSLFSSYTFANAKNLEYRVKAAYLYNFTKFIQWPSEALSNNKDDALNICILGQDPFGHAIDSLVNKTVQGHNIAVKYIDIINNQQCHIIFITKSNEKNVSEILNALSNNKSLTISDIDNFASKGGGISLYISNGKVIFNVNLKATKQANLLISAKLLELAKTVIE